MDLSTTGLHVSPAVPAASAHNGNAGEPQNSHHLLTVTNGTYAGMDYGLLLLPSADNDDNICDYKGTDYLEVKILLIGVFATGLALLSLIFNAFFSLVFALNSRLRRSPLYYFGVLALLDLALAINYLALMSVPVYMDQFRLLWLYHLFLAYLRPMLALSHFAMFASVLMILLATAERLLQTFSGRKVAKTRRLLQRHRPQLTLLVMGASFAYKLCTYFEIEVVEHSNCTDFERFEVRSAVEGPEWDVYRFWWMFVSRNMIDHIVPFFLLINLNFCIIRALNRERIRATYSFASAAASASAVPLRAPKGNEHSRSGSGSGRSLRESLRKKVTKSGSGGGGSGGRNAVSTAEEHIQKKNLRAATRTLIAVVSMYLMSKVLQVGITFFETFGTEETIEAANYGPFRPLYSYVNDAISILTLLSSTLRFPVYCACNKPILTASKDTLRRLIGQSTDSANQKSSSVVITDISCSSSRQAPPLRLQRKCAANAAGATTASRRKGSSIGSSIGTKSPQGKRRVIKFVAPNGSGDRRGAVNGPAAARIAISGIDEAELVAMIREERRRSKLNSNER